MTITDTLNITTSGERSAAIFAQDSASILSIDNIIATSGDISAGAGSENYAQLMMANNHILTTGMGSPGLMAHGEITLSDGLTPRDAIYFYNGSITTQGEYSSAVMAGKKAQVRIVETQLATKYTGFWSTKPGSLCA